jgi:hypothetical protein
MNQKTAEIQHQIIIIESTIAETSSDDPQKKEMLSVQLY